MTARQRSASSLSQHAAASNSSSPGGYNSNGSRDGLYRQETDPIILSAAEIPSFHGDVMPITSYGDTYPAMTATYIPSGVPPSMSRPRAHTNSGSGADGQANIPSTAYGNLRPQTSRSSMLSMSQPGMGMRHVSASALDSSSRQNYPGAGPNQIPSRNGPSPAPPQASNLPAHALNQREYQPHYASRNEYQRPSNNTYHPLGPPPLYTSQSSYTQQRSVSHQGPPLQVPHGNGGVYLPHYQQGTGQYNVPKSQSDMYRMSQQSSDSLVSRLDPSESEYNPSVQSSQSGNRSAPQSAGTGIHRSGHAHSPLATSHSALTVTHEVAHMWTLDRVVNYLDRHNFSNEWQQAFKNLDVYGVEFLELGASRGNIGVYSHILPEVMRINPQADENRERNNAKEIKKMIQDVLKWAHSTEEGPGHGALAPMRQQVQRRTVARSATTDSYTSDGPNHRPTPSDSSARGRNEHTKAAFGSTDSVRQSPPITEGQNQSGHAPRPSVGSPHDSPNLGYSARHNHSNSSESVVSASRAGEGKNDNKALKVLGIKTGRDKDNSSHERGRQDQMEKRGGGGLFDKVIDFIRPRVPDNGNEEDSPTSPGRKRELPFVTNNNGSSSSIDRASVTSLDGFRRNPPSRPNRPVYVFATRDSKTWMSLEITRIESVEELRKDICAHVGVNDWQTAHVYQTEVGQKVHEDFLKDNTLYNLCRNKADSYATLKFFVRPSPSSAVDSPARPQIFEEPESAKSTSSVQVAPLFHKNPESNTSALRQEQVIADLETKDRVESLAERGHVSPTVEHTVDDLLSRLETLKSHQETAGNPNIKVIPPGFALPGSPPANSQQGSVQQSPTEGVDQGYPTFGSTWEGDYSTTIRTADPSPIDGPQPAARDTNELFLPQGETAPGPDMRRMSRTASGGTHALEAITRQSTGATPPAAATPTAAPPEKLRRKPSKPLDIQNSKFGKVAPTHGRVVDFDNPRPSPYEDRKMDTLIPQPQLIPHREPPPPPTKRTPSGSWSRLQGRPSWPEAGRGHAQAPRPRQDSVDNKPMVQIRDRRVPSPSARQNNNDGAVNPGRGIAAAMISAGVQVAGIAGTPIPGTQRKDVPVAASASSTPPSKPELRLPKSDGPASSERIGSRLSSPRLSWAMDFLFKGPDCVADSVPPAPAVQKLKLQIPTQATKQPTPEISPKPVFEISNREPDRQPEGNHGRETQFEENNVEFDAAPAQAAAQDDDDSDSDDGLFAIPIAARQEKASAVDIPKTILETHNEEENTDSPKPSSEDSMSMKKDVRFKSPATTSTTGSDSGPATHTPPSPEYEEGDDRRGINSPSVYGGNSQPSSATGFSRSPSDYSGLNRANSFIRDDVWASRPPAEALINNLDELFPNLDLDQPILDETNLSPPISPTSATEKPQSYQLSDPPLPTPISEIPELPEGSPSDPPTHPAPPIPTGPGNRMSIVAQRNINRTGLGRMKSIRDVVKDTHKKRYTQPTGEGSTKNDMLLRRKSTKFFGAKLIDMTPTRGERGKRGTMSAQQRQLWNQHQVAAPAAPGVQRQATFRWFKGQLIGKGTYGRVYLGMNATSGEFLAVKQVEVEHTMGGDGERRKEMIAALNCEIETMQHLDHVNIVQYLGCERKDYGMSIFLEYISGGSVGSCLRKHGRFTEPVVRSLTRQTLSGLQYLHSEGILHRDLKADNILLDVDGTCKISDFGISKKSDNIYGDDPGNSMQGSVFWMAPEVIRPEGQGYSAKIDIWSLGCVVLEMFAGRRPWSKEEAIGAIYKLGSERQAPPVPDDVSSVISPSAIGFLADCHTIDASERPTASTLLQDHEFCSPDPNFNFLDTELYKKIRP